MPLLAALLVSFLADPIAAPAELAVEERVIAGGEDGDFMTVRHLKLSGSQRAIGRKLAELASERHGFLPPDAADPARTRAIRRYFEKNSPLQLERMRGAAESFGIALDEDEFELGSLDFGMTKPACTVVYYPPAVMETGKGVLSRNFDFTTGTFQGSLPRANEIPVCSVPYVLELHPDQGYATLALVSYDLLGVVDGMNSEGLCAALLADDELTSLGRAAPADGPQPGFGVLQILRHVLETCADAEEAKAALLDAKLTYSAIPCHYVFADRHGRSFVWENSASLAQGHIFDGGGEVQVSTNYMQHLHPDPAKLPDETEPYGNFRRARTVLERARELGPDGKLSVADVRDASACVAAVGPAPGAPRAAGRTLWHALYFPEERRVEVDFYLGESSSGGALAIRRSPVVAFTLESEN